MTASRSTAWPTADELVVDTVGEARYRSPVERVGAPFVDDDDRVLIGRTVGDIAAFAGTDTPPPSFEPAGARRLIAHDPATLVCGIVTCGGLCPGLNNVVRSIVLSLTYAYGVKRILGFRYGYAGLAAGSPHEPLPLTPEIVDSLHEQGGTHLGTSRGPQDVGGMVDTLERLGVQILFVLGGDGGLRGASVIHHEVRRRRLRIGVVGVPKTIDNDISWTTRSFGFSTAIASARTVLQAAHTEARAVWNGISLVKLMGRHSGVLAAHATLANADVNICLVPEVPITLDGEQGFLRVLERRLAAKHHAVVVVAEGAAQELFRGDEPTAFDASGNVKLIDVGPRLRSAIATHFADRGVAVTIRYFDPGYVIRSMPADPIDAVYCLALGQHAVHAGMAGRTNVLVSSWNDRFVHVPIPLAVARRRQLETDGAVWQHVLESTGQEAILPRRA